MEKLLEEKLKIVKDTLKQSMIYRNACAVLQYDLETICPPKAMEAQGETNAFLANEGFKLVKSDEFIEAAEYCFEHRFGSGSEEAPGDDGLEYLDRILAESLHRGYNRTKNVTPEKNLEWQLITNRSYVKWLEAKEAKDFGIFAPVFEEVKKMNFEQVELRDEKCATAYDTLLSDYERGITSEDIDLWFGKCKDRLITLLGKVQASEKKIRTDFLFRPLEDSVQEKMARYMLETIGFDFTRGAFTTTEHPFTSGLAKNDIRVTTHYREDFSSNIFSIIHEGGHALFSQLIPEENYDHFLEDEMTMGMHESVSRFYENRIGRSRAFISLVYPKIKELAGDVMADVTEEELYEAVNSAQPSYIRTEADELTYSLHIIIRYALEKALMSGELEVKDLPKAWNDKYEEYLGIRPRNDVEGVLQDVHWTWGYGYFPTYALGNMYNAMYFNRMKEELDTDELIRRGDFATINSWMKENVFARACYLTPKEWMKEITGRDITPDDYLDYLEEKYSKIYGF